MKYRLAIVAFATLIVGAFFGLGYWTCHWRNSPERRVYRLATEPWPLEFDVLYMGRLPEDIHCDWMSLGPKEIPALIDTLRSSRAHNYMAASSLGMIRDERGFEPLMDAASSENADVVLRVWSLRALGDWRDPRALIQVMPALDEHNDVQVQMAAAEAAGKIADRRACKPLLLMLRNSNYLLRSSAAKALGTLGDSRAVEPLMNEAKTKQDRGIRIAAIKALGIICDSRAITVLEECAKEDSPEIARAATEALQRIRDSQL